MHLMDSRKNQFIKAYERGDSIRKIARDLSVDRMVIQCWVETYKFHGPAALLNPTCVTYNESFKLKVIQHMIETTESYAVVAGRFHIPSRATIWKWMKRYMSEAEWALYLFKRERRDMMKNKPTKQITDSQKLQEEIEYLRAENAYLKKLHALVQEKERSKQKKK